ncbi:hypothetical protein CF65_02427 [Aggregatibacter actinomycetemcomitans HK1651]|nr:hypothetical protein CF65_02427 [Aggregatibacter actinomycetemcomitans HK1651]
MTEIRCVFHGGFFLFLLFYHDLCFFLTIRKPTSAQVRSKFKKKI